MKNLQKDIHGPGERLTKKKTQSRPDRLWPEIQKYGTTCQTQLNKKKTKVGYRKKPKLDSARKLRGLYFFDPKDEKLKKTIFNARRKLEVPMEAAMPCKIRRSKHGETCRNPDARKTKYACIVEADGSTRKRLEGTLHKDHEDHHIAGNGIHALINSFLCLKQ